MRFGNFGKLANYKPLCPYPCPDRKPLCRETCPTGIEDKKRRAEVSAALKAKSNAESIIYGYARDTGEHLNHLKNTGHY